MKNEKELYELIKVSRSIEKIYNNLYECEINNNKEDFYKQLDYLSISLDVEDSIYKSINFNTNNLQYLIVCLKNDFMSQTYKSNLECLITNDTQDFVIRRILSKLVILLASISNSSNILINFLDSIGIIEKGSIETITNAEKIIYLIDTNNIINLYNNLSDFEISKDLDEKELKRLKYSLSMINYDIEKQLLKKEFNNDKLFKLNHIISNVKEKYSINEDNYLAIIGKYVKTCLNKQIDEMENINIQEDTLRFVFRSIVVLGSLPSCSAIDCEMLIGQFYCKLDEASQEEIKKISRIILNSLEEHTKKSLKKKIN